MGTIKAMSIPYKNFKEKIRITKEFRGRRMEDWEGVIYIEF